jgi:hypothetical protein
VAGQTVSCIDSGVVQVGERVSFDIVARVGSIGGSGAPATVVNTVHASTDGDADPSNDYAFVTVMVRVPDVRLTMGVRRAGTNNLFGSTVDVNNGAQLEIRWDVGVSGGSVSSTTTTATLPAGLKFVRTAFTPGLTGNHCLSTGQTVSCQTTGLTPGDSREFRFVVHVQANLAGIGRVLTLVTTAQVSAPVDADPSNNVASVTVNVSKRE